ncbi:MAG: zinc-binding alcohol dehydrogenase [Pseudomonadota bacterium]
MDIKAHALVYSGPRQTRIDEVVLPDMAPGLVEVVAECSAISRGTERLVFEGRVPEAEWTRMRAPHQVGAFPFPVRYGYASVGRVAAGPQKLLDRHVFCLFPHQTRYRVPVDAVVPVPKDVPPARAVLAANMETALNAVWDAAPQPGMRCLVVGAGLLGALITACLSSRSDISVDVTDKKADPVVKWADVDVNFMSPQDVVPQSFDLAFHTSASGPGLQTAIDALNFEGRLIELSWHGDRKVEVRLGGNFHANRLQIISSQVGHIAPSRRNAISYSDRLALALDALHTEWLDQLITEEIAFSALPEELPRLLHADAPGIATRIVY